VGVGVRVLDEKTTTNGWMWIWRREGIWKDWVNLRGRTESGRDPGGLDEFRGEQKEFNASPSVNRPRGRNKCKTTEIEERKKDGMKKDARSKTHPA
jgi:hypothetical protein